MTDQQVPEYIAQAAWDAVAKVRDAHPRLADDADSWEVVEAVLDVVVPALRWEIAMNAMNDALAPIRELRQRWDDPDTGWRGVRTQGPRGGYDPTGMAVSRTWERCTNDLLSALAEAAQPQERHPGKYADPPTAASIRAALDSIGTGP